MPSVIRHVMKETFETNVTLIETLLFISINVGHTNASLFCTLLEF